MDNINKNSNKKQETEKKRETKTTAKKFYNKNKPHYKKNNYDKKVSKEKTNTLDKDFIEVVGVNFRPAGTIYYYRTDGLKLSLGQNIIVKAPKGFMFARVVLAPVYIPKNKAIYYDPISKTYDQNLLKSKISTGSIDGTIDHDSKLPTNLLSVERIATEHDVKKHNDNLKRIIDINKTCKYFIKKHKLNMKLVQSELTFDGKKLSVFYTAESRVNFKALIEDLLKEYKGVRIELRQIDVRSETKIIGGLGPCGQELCCAKFNTNPPQVNIKTLKEQGISLNPAKINGLCGKLKCCFSYEINVYKDIKEKLPKIEKFLKIKDDDGNILPAKLIRINTLPRTITAVDEHGSFITVPIDNIVETRNKAYWEE